MDWHIFEYILNAKNITEIYLLIKSDSSSFAIGTRTYYGRFNRSLKFRACICTNYSYTNMLRKSSIIPDNINTCIGINRFNVIRLTTYYC
ncbi:MAG: hypothetical protein J6581_07480 [Apibacter sp.]|nr:hypothetical protein [Apibacter sp.]